MTMKRAVEQETLQALVETGAAREFRVLREGEAWRLELRLGVKWLPVRSRAVALTDGSGAFLRRSGDQGADGGTLTRLRLRFPPCAA